MRGCGYIHGELCTIKSDERAKRLLVQRLLGLIWHDSRKSYVAPFQQRPANRLKHRAHVGRQILSLVVEAEFV